MMIAFSADNMADLPRLLQDTTNQPVKFHFGSDSIIILLNNRFLTENCQRDAPTNYWKRPAASRSGCSDFDLLAPMLF